MRAITKTAEWRRINALPRRKARDWDLIAAELTAILRMPEGTMSLRPIQAQALIECAENRGLFGAIGVGYGKTLISLLIPYVLDSVRPVLVLPAALIPKTRDEQRELANHWRVAQNIQMMSYDELGRVQNKTKLEASDWDLLMLDEAHRAKNFKAAVTKRIKKSVEAHPQDPVVCLSGTMMVKSFKDFSHLVEWCLKERAPVPSGWEETNEWADLLDRDVQPFKRPLPGALLEWLPSGTPVDGIIDSGRKAFNARFSDTPGVVMTTGQSVDANIYLRGVLYQPSAITEANFTKLRGEWVTPDDWPLGMATEMAMYAKQLALGFHGVWDPRPPKEWRDARKEWFTFTRETLTGSRKFESPKEVELAVLRGEIADGGLLAAWKKVEPTYQIQTKDIWHDETALNLVAKWMKEHPGLVWVSHVFFGEELSKRTGVPYFGPEALDASGRHLSHFHNQLVADRKQLPAICSTKACVEGLNLQKAWDTNLMTSPMSSPKDWEQILGRTHRQGCRGDTVHVDVMIGCLEHWDSLQKAFEGARVTEATMAQVQKLNLCDRILPKEVDVLSQPGSIWNR